MLSLNMAYRLSVVPAIMSSPSLSSTVSLSTVPHFGASPRRMMSAMPARRRHELEAPDFALESPVSHAPVIPVVEMETVVPAKACLRPSLGRTDSRVG